MPTKSTRAMQGFAGFPAGKASMVKVPTLFFSDLMPIIDDLAELKVTIYCFWALQQREGKHRYVRLRDLQADEVLLGSLSTKPEAARQALLTALERATARGTLLHVLVPTTVEEHLYFMNTERGRQAVDSLERGDWQSGDLHTPIGAILERPNIFSLYEQNIGPLTPMLSEMLRDAETTYPADWLADAMKIAVESNKRNWRYIEAVLKRWATEGRHPSAKQRTAKRQEDNPYLQDDYFRKRDGEDEA